MLLQRVTTQSLERDGILNLQLSSDEEHRFEKFPAVSVVVSVTSVEKGLSQAALHSAYNCLLRESDQDIASVDCARSTLFAKFVE